MTSRFAPDRQRAGLIYGMIGVLAFSLTLLATRVAVASFGATAVGLGRALAAAVVVSIYLGIRRQASPRRDLALLGTVAAAAMGYAEGGRLARPLGGLEVISWALVISVPLVALLGGRPLLGMTTAAPRAAWMMGAALLVVLMAAIGRKAPAVGGS